MTEDERWTDNWGTPPSEEDFDKMREIARGADRKESDAKGDKRRAVTKEEADLLISILNSLSSAIAMAQPDSCAPFPAEKDINRLAEMFDQRIEKS